MMNDGNDWIVDIDLEKFFDTVNHDKLMTIIGRTIKDGDVISIVRKYLVSGIMIDDEYEDSIVGTPQGGNLSPLLANIMLNELDKEMEKRGLNFVRYADDCIIMVGSEMSANRVMRNISRFIEEKLGLKVNMTKSKVDRPRGIKYLGFGFYYDTSAQQFKAKPHAKSVMDCQHFFRQIFLGYFSDIVQAFDTLRKNVCGDDYTSLHNPIVLSSVLPAYGMFHSIQILFL